MRNQYGKIVLLTGASSGIGKAIAIKLAENGFSVYGASRRGGTDVEFDNGFVHMIQADVTSDESVALAVTSVLEREGRIDILINAAGNGICGAVEECSAKDAQYQFDTNYFGVIRMINAVVPQMRERRNGLVVNIGSVGGIFTVPFQTLYSSSKAAVDIMTEGLRIELAPFNVHACVVEPGDIKTGFTAARTYAERAKNSVYGEPFRRSIAQMEKDESGGKSPDTIAASVLKVISKKKPPVRVVVGAQYKFFVFLKRILSARLVEVILTAMYPNSKN